MVLYLRNQKNETILDAEYYEKDNYLDLSSTVCIEAYSKMLLELPEDRQIEAITEFDNLQELRGWLWESYFCGKQNTSDAYEVVLEVLRHRLNNVAKKYNLIYVED